MSWLIYLYQYSVHEIMPRREGGLGVQPHLILENTAPKYLF